MMVALDGLRACYLAVSLCMGVQHAPPMPKVEIIPGSKFQCGWNADGSNAYCAGLTDTDGTIVVASAKMMAVPHEFIHRIVKKRHLWAQNDDGGTDSAHEGPWWHCEQRVEIPACDGLWGDKPADF